MLARGEGEGDIMVNCASLAKTKDVFLFFLKIYFETFILLDGYRNMH
jgi:hypothetical protein